MMNISLIINYNMCCCVNNDSCQIQRDGRPRISHSAEEQSALDKLLQKAASAGVRQPTRLAGRESYTSSRYLQR